MLRLIKWAYRAIFKPRLHSAEVQMDFEVLGTIYGGWPLVLDATSNKSLVYSFGVGEDISFDLEAIHRFGCVIHAFDPTPRCQRWIEQQTLPHKMTFHPIGIAAQDGETTFYAPENGGHVSFSAAPAQKSDAALAITAQVKRLQTIVNELGTGDPDVLKIDIEGFEYEVIEDILKTDIRPKQWLIEFHHRMYGISEQRTLHSVNLLKNDGYKLFYVSDTGHEYGFIRI